MCSILFGLIYALNMSYPSELKHTFDALQKIFMEIEPKKMTRRVCQALNIWFIKTFGYSMLFVLFYSYSFIAKLALISFLLYFLWYKYCGTDINTDNVNNGWFVIDVLILLVSWSRMVVMVLNNLTFMHSGHFIKGKL